MRRPQLLLRCLVFTMAAGLGVAPATAAATASLQLVVQMPLATVRAQEAGVPLDALGALTSALIDAAVPPRDFIEIVRYAPVEVRLVEVQRTVPYPVDVVWLDDGGFLVRRVPADVAPALPRAELVAAPGLGAYVQRLHARGLRGPRLATAIHRELRRRGVPAGPKEWRPAPAPVRRDFVVIRDEVGGGGPPAKALKGKGSKAKGPKAKGPKARGRGHGAAPGRAAGRPSHAGPRGHGRPAAGGTPGKRHGRGASAAGAGGKGHGARGGKDRAKGAAQAGGGRGHGHGGH